MIVQAFGRYDDCCFENRRARWCRPGLSLAVVIIGIMISACGGSDSTGAALDSNQFLIAASAASAPMDQDKSDIWSIDSDTGETRRLTDSGDAGAPEISPSRKQIAFRAFMDGWNDELWIMDVDGNNPRHITELNAAWGTPVWSPDGRTIAIMGPEKVWTSPPTETAQQGIFLVDVESGSVRRLPLWEGIFDYPSWSPSGDRLSFMEFVGVSTEPNLQKLWVVGVDGTGAEELSIEFDSFDQPVWSADGEHIVFFVPGIETTRSLWSVDIDDGQSQKIVDIEYQWKFSPDGSTIAYSRRSEESVGELWVVGIDGSSPRRIAAFDDSAALPTDILSEDAIFEEFEWSPGSDRILWSSVFLQVRDTSKLLNPMLWIVDVTGKRDPQVIDIDQAPYRLPISAAWAPGVR